MKVFGKCFIECGLDIYKKVLLRNHWQRNITRYFVISRKVMENANDCLNVVLTHFAAF